MLRRKSPDPTSATSPRNFRNHHHAAQTIVGPAPRSATAADFQISLISVVSLVAGMMPNTKPCQKRMATGKSQHAGIELESIEPVEKKTEAGKDTRFCVPGRLPAAAAHPPSSEARCFRSKASGPGWSAPRPRRANAQSFSRLAGLREQQNWSSDAGDPHQSVPRPSERRPAREKAAAGLIDPPAPIRFRGRVPRCGPVVRADTSFSRPAAMVFMCLALPRQTPTFGFNRRLSKPTESAVILEILELAGRHVVAHV